MALHSQLTGADLHEPKGVESASANQVYVADGSGSGSWQKLTGDSLDTDDIQNPNNVYLHAVLPDVSTSSSILVPAPSGCTFESAVLVLGAAITTADASVTFVRNDASSFGSAVTIVQAASAEGTTFTFTATTNKTITANGYVKITTDGASDTAVPLYIILRFLRTP